MATQTSVSIQRQDPEIEAYRLGLLGDTQQLVRDQIFGQNVQNLRDQGLSNAQIAQRLDVARQTLAIFLKTNCLGPLNMT